jgi:hypothetical protein
LTRSCGKATSNGGPVRQRTEKTLAQMRLERRIHARRQRQPWRTAAARIDAAEHHGARRIALVPDRIKQGPGQDRDLAAGVEIDSERSGRLILRESGQCQPRRWHNPAHQATHPQQTPGAFIQNKWLAVNDRAAPARALRVLPRV